MNSSEQQQQKEITGSYRPSRRAARWFPALSSRMKILIRGLPSVLLPFQHVCSDHLL